MQEDTRSRVLGNRKVKFVKKKRKVGIVEQQRDNLTIVFAR